MNTTKERQVINDTIRKKMDLITFSKGIQSYNQKDISKIVNLVKNYTNFNELNDPSHLHNFGIFEYNGEGIIWLIRRSEILIMKVSECAGNQTA